MPVINHWELLTIQIWYYLCTYIYLYMCMDSQQTTTNKYFIVNQDVPKDRKFIINLLQRLV